MYYVLFQSYTEYNQFEGYWSKDWATFKRKSSAEAFIKTCVGETILTHVVKNRSTHIKTTV